MKVLRILGAVFIASWAVSILAVMFAIPDGWPSEGKRARAGVHCVVFGHLVGWGPCPRCGRRAA